MSTLYRGGFVYSPADPFANAMVVDGGTIAWIGGDDAAAVHADGVDEVVELDGALVTPAFVDAHAHLSQTGAALRGVDVSGAPSLAVVDSQPRRGRGPGPARAGRCTPRTGTSGRWPSAAPHTAAELDRATYGGVVYMPRVDGHSAVISSALAAASGAQQQPGWDGRGPGDPGRAPRGPRGVQRAPSPRPSGAPTSTWPCSAAAAAGIGLVQENGGRILSSADDFADVLAAGERGDGPQTLGYWAAARRRPSRRPATPPPLLGAHGLAGDLNVDGSIGSRTAHLRDPYADAAGPLRQRLPHASSRSATTSPPARWPASRPASTSSATPVSTTVVAGFEAAADLVGADVVRRARHRLEHLEMIDADGHRSGWSPSASAPACSPRSTPSGAGTRACMPRGWARERAWARRR